MTFQGVCIGENFRLRFQVLVSLSIQQGKAYLPRDGPAGGCQCF